MGAPVKRASSNLCIKRYCPYLKRDWHIICCLWDGAMLKLNVTAVDEDLEALLGYLQSLSHLKLESKEDLLERGIAWLRLGNRYYYRSRRIPNVSLEIDDNPSPAPLNEGTQAQCCGDRKALVEQEPDRKSTRLN